MWSWLAEGIKGKRVQPSAAREPGPEKSQCHVAVQDRGSNLSSLELLKPVTLQSEISDSHHGLDSLQSSEARTVNILSVGQDLPDR